MSVTGPRFGVLRVWLQHLLLSSSGCCQASGTSSAMSTNSRSKIFLTSLGGRAVIGCCPECGSVAMEVDGLAYELAMGSEGKEGVRQ